MPEAPPTLDPVRRTWHLTFGTYATRLHHDPRPTVDRRHNQPGTPFPPPAPSKQQAPAHPPVYLSRAQCEHIEQALPAICTRGNWTFRTCAAPCDVTPPPSEPGRAGPVPPVPQAGHHVHLLLDAPKDKPPKAIRQWLKRWLTESLNQRFPTPPSGWWADAGSTKPVTEESYLRNATNYITRQRTTPPE